MLLSGVPLAQMGGLVPLGGSVDRYAAAGPCGAASSGAGSAGSGGRPVGPPSAQPRAPSLVRPQDTASAGSPDGTPTSPPSQQQGKPRTTAAARRSERKRRTPAEAVPPAAPPAKRTAPPQRQQQQSGSDGDSQHGTHGSHESANLGPAALAGPARGSATALHALAPPPAPLPLDLPGLDDLDDVPGLDDLLMEEGLLLDDPFGPSPDSPWGLSADPFAQQQPQQQQQQPAAPEVHVPGPRRAAPQHAPPQCAPPQAQQPLPPRQPQPQAVQQPLPHTRSPFALPQASQPAAAAVMVPHAQQLPPLPLAAAHSAQLAAATAATLPRGASASLSSLPARQASLAAPAAPAAATRAAAAPAPRLAGTPVFSGTLAPVAEQVPMALSQPQPVAFAPAPAVQWLCRDPSRLRPVQRAAQAAPARPEVNAAELKLSAAAPLVAAGMAGDKGAAPAGAALLRCLFGASLFAV